MVISSNYSFLWQYLDPSQLLPKLLEKFLITEEMKEEAESYSGYAQTSIILRGLFYDYCPPNRLFKLCDTLDTLPGQEHLGRKLLQGSTVHSLQVQYSMCHYKRHNHFCILHCAVYQYLATPTETFFQFSIHHPAIFC